MIKYICTQKNPYESKYQYLINKREGVDTDHFNDPKAFIEFSNDMRDVYKNFDECNTGKKLNSTVTELFIRARKLNVCLVSILQSFFMVRKDVRLNTSHFFIAKISNKREL